MSQWISSNLGYPRIGANREWKKALEAFWAGKVSEQDFLTELKGIRLRHLRLQQEKGIDLIPVGDFSLYDHVLDTSTMFGIVPDRYDYESGPVSLSTYYAMARGNDQAAASEMTKWFNTNYHYIVPELAGANPVLTVNRPLVAYLEAKQELGIEGKPVIIGLYTFLKLSKGYSPSELPSLVERFLPVYRELLSELQQAGVKWVQVDEPVLVTDIPAEDWKLVEAIYEDLHQAAPELKILLQTYFEAAEEYEKVTKLPVQGIGLDLVHGGEANLAQIRKYGFPQDKVLAAGLIDGRNIWRSDLLGRIHVIKELTAFVSPDRLIIQPSSSLLHTPVSLAKEDALLPVLRNSLAFADEKLDEIKLLVELAGEDINVIHQQLAENTKALSELNTSVFRSNFTVREALENVNDSSFKRKSDFSARHAAQQQKFQLPLLPTTTIGSFPQTAEVRKARRQWRNGQLTDQQYETFVDEQTKEWIDIQEELGLDVLVHGEFERTDMVEFFGEKLGGFAFTQGGWVQSYGSRCVKPPIIFGDVVYQEPMTLRETVYAQSLTSKPVKGMLTGPVTILNWSFVRTDIPRSEVAYQIGLALRKEVEALESAGIEMIQVDEPALREGLPLKSADHESYLTDSVKAFKLSTSSVKDTTQIHTHMCYCEFHDVIESIEAMDADVISLETSRSHGELIENFKTQTYDKGIGLGVYDIHSPRVPSVNEMKEVVVSALEVLDPELFWINPDCGLKTRGKEETVAALRNMVAAAGEARNSIKVPSL
ncbi:5-methyltetrahydropteroyltriglutamate--homocysteine S-methyltransferase [Paenibacillus sp. Marseille-Q4541]|uniref:5-methyltetrahydropteroyltriglutamate-- homocysteine S-methyltransferase n=1 Tax=Paenibacillus sp. Marseille-Q4541 TaxID=2831522 RepID=UPI001BABC8DD|nr:5-methyltetrahydropteroyltriglutamate--homocysteine S-methyltransferase [Paenibacillus sp. Marseille-Q4541]